MFTLFHGKNSYLSRREADVAYNSLIKDYSGYSLHILNGEILEPEEIVRTYQTSDMFGGGKILYIKRLYKNKQKAELVENIIEYLGQNPPDTHIIIWEDQKIPSNTKYFKFFRSAGSEKEAQDLNKRTFISWGKDEARRFEVSVANDLIYLLAENANYDPERYSNLIQKLKLKQKEKLSKEDVEDVSVTTYEYDIWKLLDAINGKPGPNSFEILDRLLMQKVEPLFILTMLTRNIRQMILIKDMLSLGFDSKKIASTLKIPPFTLPGLISSAERSTFQRLTQIYQKLYNLDYEIKTGNIDPEIGLTLVLTIF